MRRNIKSIIGILLSIALVVPNLCPIVNAAVISTEDLVFDKITDTEQKIICKATIEEEFEDDSVIVVLKKNANPDFNTLTKEDFSEVSVNKVESLTKQLEPLIKSVRQISDAEVMTARTQNTESSIKDLAVSSGRSVDELVKLEENFNQIIKIDLKSAGKQNVLDSVKELEKREDVLSVQPNYIYRMCDSPVTNDTHVSSQWAIGAMQLNEAWNITKGDPELLVGIMDSGIYREHEDLDDNINNELSRDYAQDYDRISPHGTKVAGVIGAEGNNSQGVAGVCWYADLVDLQVFHNTDQMSTEEFYSSTGNLVSAITHAEIMGIRILNFSGGNNSPDTEYDNALKTAIETYSGLFVCAAGNYESETDKRDNDTAPHYPASYDCDNIIAVAASNESEQLWVDSFYGRKSVDLAAPGENIYTTTYVGLDVQLYTTVGVSGTSYAAPQVAGVAALLLSHNPNLTTDQLKAAILASVDKSATYDGKCVTGGRLNAYKALQQTFDETYTVTYDANGGTGSMSDTTMYYGVNTYTRFNEFVRDGYDFDCWYAHRESDNKWKYQNADQSESGWYLEGQQPEGWVKYRFEDGASSDSLSSIDGDTVTFHAQWKQYFIIRYNNGGANGTMEDTKVTYLVRTPLRQNEFTATDNEFVCWYAHRESDNKWRYQNADKSDSDWYLEGQQPEGWVKYEYLPSMSVYATSNVPGDIITFYAQWEKHYTIVFDANGGTGAMDSLHVIYGVRIPTTSNAFTRIGYDFDCWYAHRQSDNKWRYQNEDQSSSGWYLEGQQPEGWIKFQYPNETKVYASSSVPNDIVTFYAQWKQYFIIRYNGSGATGTMEDTKVTYLVRTPISENKFTVSNNEFSCWYAHRQSDNKWRYQNADKSASGWYLEGQQPSGWVKYEYLPSMTLYATSDVPGDVIIFYVQWEKYFIVRYSANGGSGTMSDTKVFYNIPTTTTSNAFVREGYDFDCWNIQRSFDGKWRYKNYDTGESGWYDEGQQPEGMIKYRYENNVSVSATTSVHNAVITFHAQWKKYFIIRYDANSGEGVAMPDTKVIYGVDTRLSANTYTKQGYEFDCWFVYRSSDSKWRYRNPENKSQTGFYLEGQQPSGWEKMPYVDAGKLAKTSSVPGDIVYLYAQWIPIT